jgi:hypothetical protein
MSMAYPTATSRRLIRLLDVALVAWTVAWVLMGLVVAREVRSLTQLSNTVVAGGRVLLVTGSELNALSSLPFVGDQIRTMARQVDDAADQAIASGRDSRGQVRSLSALLGLAIALVPTVPLIALYAPLRVGRIREVRAIRRAVAAAPDDPVLRQFLARRALERLPYDRLRLVTADPWADLAAGQYEDLAAAELERLGLSRASRRMRMRTGARPWPQGTTG